MQHCGDTTTFQLTVELEKNLHEVFTITEKAPTRALKILTRESGSSHFQPGEGPSSGLLSDCEKIVKKNCEKIYFGLWTQSVELTSWPLMLRVIRIRYNRTAAGSPERAEDLYFMTDQ